MDTTNDTETSAVDADQNEAVQAEPMQNPDLSSGDQNGAVTPLEAVTDWDELERRLGAEEAVPGDEATGTEEPGAGKDAAAKEPQQQNSQLPKNFRFRTEDPQRARFYQLMRQHPDANPAELAQAAGYMAAVESAAKTAGAEPGGNDPLHGLREEIASLMREKRACREAYEFDKADELGERLLEARLELERKTREVAENRVTQARYEAAYADARGEATRLHPATDQAGTRQHRLVQMLVAAKEQEDPAFFQDPAYPLRLIGELERDFPEAFPRGGGARGVSGAGGRAGAEGGSGREEREAMVPARASRPLGQAVAGNATSAHIANRAALLRQIDSLGVDQLEALANALGTRQG